MTGARTAADWSAYWRGRGGAGEAFAGEGVEQHPALRAHWDGVFAGGEGAVLDLACGAGSVLRRAHAAGLAPLLGADVSADALALLAEAVPGAWTVLCSADAVPLADGGFGLVASQFGFEYAGPRAPAEMARLVAPGGQLAALVHHAGGAIEQEVTRHAGVARAVSETGFVEAADRLIRAEFAARSGDAGDLGAARAGFAGPERGLAALARATPGGLAAHLHGGYRQLYQRRAAYALSDVTGWLDGMKAELSAYEGRMATMRAAAKDRDGMDAVARALVAGGLADVRAEPFALPGDAAPLAWSLRARRPG